MSGIRVAVVDDQPLFCSGLQMLLESQDDLEFAGSAHDGATALELAVTARPDVMLMDVRMPGMDGIEATERIIGDAATASAAPPRIVVLTTFQRDEAIVRAIRAGAHGFLVKDATPEFVLAAIRTVHSGHSVIAPSDTAQLLRAHSELAGSTLRRDVSAEATLAALSVREREVFLLAARGLSNAEIAQSAYIGETTVKSHMSSILAKLDLASRVQLVAFAYENALVR